jgi:hypothetical protein
VTADNAMPAENAPPAKSVFGSYCARLLELYEDSETRKELPATSFAAAFFLQLRTKHVLETMAEMDRLLREMHAVLNEFTGRRLVLFDLLTVEHLATAMKLYVISWGTILDLVARLVNEVLNLGIADRDVRLARPQKRPCEIY